MKTLTDDELKKGFEALEAEYNALINEKGSADNIQAIERQHSELKAMQDEWHDRYRKSLWSRG